MLKAPRILPILLCAALLTSTCKMSPACPVTIPNGNTPPGESANALYHGNGMLWTALWPDGQVIFSPGGPGEIRSDGSLAMKFPWWRADGVRGDIEVSGRRLDGPGSGVLIEAPAGYGDSGFQASTLVFPSQGCWEISAHVDQAELRFVLKIIKEP